MSTKPNKCIGTTIADGTMSSRAGGSAPSMDVISAKTLEVVLRVMHEFTLGERKHIGIGLIASDVVWEKWTSEILSRVEKKRRTWKTSTLTTGNGGRYTSLKYMDGIIVKSATNEPVISHALMWMAKAKLEEITGRQYHYTSPNPFTYSALQSSSDQVLVDAANQYLNDTHTGNHYRTHRRRVPCRACGVHI